MDACSGLEAFCRGEEDVLSSVKKVRFVGGRYIWANGDEEGEIPCLGKTEGGMEEIGCSEEEEETQEDSKGCSQNSHRCKG